MPARPPPFPCSDHCDGHRFFNPQNQVVRGWGDVLRWKLSAQPQPWPAWVDLVPQVPPPLPAGATVAATWINHATFLLQTPQGNVLTDPVYSDRASPVLWGGPRRVHVPGVAFSDLPRIDGILLSHDHYDHCDLLTLRRLARAFDPWVVTPLGNGPLLHRAGLRRVSELDWWEACTPAPGWDLHCTPARHWSNRVRGARNRRLWGGFQARVGDARLYFSGDTAYDETLFHEIRARLGPPDLAFLPIGAYEPRWFMAAHHCNPLEAIQIHLDLGAATSLAMHWGTFRLTDEGREEPVRALLQARRAAHLADTAFRILAPGQTFRL